MREFTVTVDLNVVNGKVFTDGRLLEGGISIDDGRIVKVGKEDSLPRSSRRLDVGGLVILPGLIDVHVHLRDMQLTYKEDFYSGTCAAAAGGFTTVLDMPNTKPITDSASLLEQKIESAKSKIIVNVGFYASFPSRLEEFRPLAEMGVAGFKAHLLLPWSKLNLEDDDVFKLVLAEASSLGKVVAVHAEDRFGVELREAKLRSSSRNSLSDFSVAHGEGSEVKAVRRVLKLLGQVKEPCRLHFCHVSSPKTVNLIKQARKVVHRISCEVTPHHLFLFEEAVKGLGGIALTCPPIRKAGTAKKLWKMLRAGYVDVVASDHAPHQQAEKLGGVIWDIPPGFPGLETTLPLMLTRVACGEVALGDVVQLLSLKPAKIFGLRSKGDVTRGKDADLVVVDLKKRHKVDPSRFYCKAKYSPFQGLEVRGKAVKTIVKGILVMDGEQVAVKPGCGTVLKLL